MTPAKVATRARSRELEAEHAWNSGVRSEREPQRAAQNSVAGLDRAVLQAVVNQRFRCSAEPWVQVSGLTRPTLRFWMRSSPTALGGVEGVGDVLLGEVGDQRLPAGVVGLLACLAQTPARQSAISSSRTESLFWPCCVRTLPMMPSRFSMWWPYSCATTYASANGPPLAPSWPWSICSKKVRSR